MVLCGTASKAGLSCQACHSNGFANEDFFIPGLSDAHGRIDVSHAFWNNRGENHRDDPLTIPSLRGVKTKDRLGHDGRGTSLREFTRRVIVTEFGDRKSVVSGKSVSVRVDLGGPRTIKKKQHKNKHKIEQK